MSAAQPQIELLEKLGEGAMGAVWRARVDGVLRAVKFTTAAFDPESLERFEREADALLRLDPAPGVLRIFGRLREPRPGLVLELVEGGDLHAWLKRTRPSVEVTLHLARAIAEALAHLHAAGIVHRDLKPANILLREPDAELPEPLLSDFGLARLTDLETLTRTGAMVGTPAYMAPEQALGRRVDARADVWAFGVIVYEMLSGRRAFVGDSPMKVLSAVLKSRPTSLATLAPEVDPSLRRLVEDCLHQDPDRRPADGSALLQRLDRLGDVDGESAPRSRVPALVAGGLAVILAAGLATAGARMLWSRSLAGAAVQAEGRRRGELRTALLRQVEERARARLERRVVDPLFRDPGAAREDRAASRDDCIFTRSLLAGLEPIPGVPASRRLPRTLAARRAAVAWLATALDDPGGPAERAGPKIAEALAAAAVWRPRLATLAGATEAGALDPGPLASDGWLRDELEPVWTFRERYLAGRPPAELARFASRAPEFCRRRLLLLVESRACVRALAADRPAAAISIHLEELERLARTEGEQRDRARAWSAELASALSEASPDVALRVIIGAARHGMGRDLAGVDGEALLARRRELAPVLDAVCRSLCHFEESAGGLGRSARLQLAMALGGALRGAGRPTTALRDMTFEDLERALEEWRAEDQRRPEGLSLERRLRRLDRLYALDAAPKIPDELVTERLGGPDFGLRAGMRRGAIPIAVVNLLSTSPTDLTATARGLKVLAGRLAARGAGSPTSAELSLGAMLYFQRGVTMPYRELPADERGDPGDLVDLTRRIAGSTDPDRFEAITRICQWSELTDKAEDTIRVANILIEVLPKRPATGNSGFNLLTGIANLKRRWFAWEAKAKALDRLGRREEAIAMLLEIQPQDLRGSDHVDQLRLLTRLGADEQARRRSIAMVRAQPDTDEAVRLGLWFLQIGDMETLDRLRGKLASPIEGDRESNVLRLRLLVALGENAAADAWLTRLQERGVTTDFARIEMAESACAIGRFPLARQLLTAPFPDLGFRTRADRLRRDHAALRESK